MIPRKLALRNFMCYRENVPTLNFDGLGIACLSGENGAGKSALLDALTWALWGEARLKSDDDLIAMGASEMEVDLTFALDHQDYRVIRKRSKGKKNGQSWLDFQVNNQGVWKTLTGATLRETQQIITGTLHMGYDTFANSAFLRQGRADEFTRKEPSKRKQVLADILGLDVYERLEGAAKERAKTFDGQLKVLEGQIAELERQAEKQSFYADEVARTETRVAEVEHELHQAQTRFDQANNQVQALEQMRPQRDELRNRIERIRRERDELLIQVEKLRTAVNENKKVVARRDEILAGVAALDAARAEAERFDTLRTSYQALEERQRSQQDTIDRAKTQVLAEIQIAQAKLDDMRRRAVRRPQLEAQIGQLKQQIGGLSNLQDELGKVRTRRSALRDQQQQASEWQLKRKDLDFQIKLKHDSLVGTREELKRKVDDYARRLKPLERLHTDLERARARQQQLENDAGRLDELRTGEHASVERAGELRAACETIKLRGEEINRKLALLSSDDAHACPLCGSELGHDGVQHIEAEYDRERLDLRAQFSVRNGEAKQIEASLISVRKEIGVLETAGGELAKLAGQIARFEADLAAADDLRRVQAEDQLTLEDVQMQLVKGDYEHGVRAELVRIDATISAIGDPAALARQMDVLENQIGRLEKQIEGQNATRAEVVSLSKKIDEIDEEQPARDEQEVQVHDLQTTLELNDFARESRVALARVEQEIAALGYTVELHRAAREQSRALAGWDEEYRHLERAEQRLTDDEAALARDETTLQRRDEERDTAVIQLNTLEEQLRALGPAIHQRDDARVQVENHRRALSVAQKDLGEKQGHLQRAENAAAELFSHRQKNKEITHRKGLFDELSVAFGKKGVQALLIETAVPEIQEEANRVLGRMTDNQMHLTFETQGATKKGDVTETLDIKIADALGTRDYDAYSGGESFRVDFAIRIALAKLLARRAGARLETLAIDEGFGSQDAKGRERLVEAITSVQGDFKQILVVTHIQELKDLFPVQIEITKKPEGSVWAIG